MRSDRLLKLADFLETVPSKAFDIRWWEKSPAYKPEGKRPGDCGFSGCAMGWAVHAKLFRGLTRDTDGDPLYQGQFGFHAATNLFGFTDIAASHFLFSDTQYPGQGATPKQVAKRIRKFVADHKGAK